MRAQQQDQGSTEPHPSSFHPWSDTTKRMVVAGGAVLGVLVLYRFRQLLPSLIIAIMLAYVLNPAVGFIVALTRLPRTAAVALLYLILIILLALVPALLAPGLIQQLRAVDLNLQRVAERLDHFLNQPLNLWGYHLEFETAWQQVRRALQDILSPMASRTVSILLSAVTGLLRIVFILVTSFYILKDQPKIVRYVHHLVPTRYQADARLLGAEINSIWSTFFRGQLILCLVVGFVVGVAMAAVGLPNAAALGALAGALEILPNIGPVMAAVPAVLIALFQGSTYLPLPTFWFVVLVVGLYTLIQQVENNYLVPQIIGRSLDLHPLVVMVAVVAGANFAGVLGALLAAPTLASSRALAGYAYRKLLDQPPFPVYADQAEADEEETDQNREAPPDIH